MSDRKEGKVIALLEEEEERENDIELITGTEIKELRFGDRVKSIVFL